MLTQTLTGFAYPQPVSRIYISGGEPLLRHDIFEILRLFKDIQVVLGLATNATKIDINIAKKLSNYIDYVSIGLDGPRKISNLMRGCYDEILKGIWSLKKVGIEFSISSVITKINAPYVLYLCQIADVLGARKIKFTPPISRGRAKYIYQKEMLSESDLISIFN